MSDANKTYTYRADQKIELEKSPGQIARQQIGGNMFPTESLVSRVDFVYRGIKG